MIEIRESFWDKFKSFFKKMFLRNKNAFSNEEQKTADEIDKIYYNGGKIEEDRIKDFEKTMDENLKLKWSLASGLNPFSIHLITNCR